MALQAPGFEQLLSAALVYLALAFRKFEKTLINKTKTPPEVVIKMENKPEAWRGSIIYRKNRVNITNVEIESDDENELIVNFTLNRKDKLKGIKEELKHCLVLL